MTQKTNGTNKATDSKEQYSKPKLTIFGDLRSLTLSKTGGKVDTGTNTMS